MTNISKIKTWLLAGMLVCAPAWAAEQVALGALAKAEYSREFALAPAMQEMIGSRAGRLYFATKEGAVAVTDLDGKVLQTLQGKDEEGKAVLKKPRSVAVGGSLVYVLDGETNQVHMFDAKGEYQGYFGAGKGGFFGGGGGVEFKSAMAVATHEGIVYVLDGGSGKIQLFGSNGVYLGALELRLSPAAKVQKGQEEQHLLQEAVDLQLDVRGQLYVLDQDESQIKQYRMNGEFIRIFPTSGKIAAFTVAQDGLYVVDRDKLFIQKYDFSGRPAYRFGSKGKDRAQFQTVSGLAAFRDRQVVVADKVRMLATVFLADAGETLPVIPKPLTMRYIQWIEAYPLFLDKLASDGGELLYGLNRDDKSVVRLRNGKQEAQFKLKDVNPVGLALDAAGALWVIDEKKGRVLKLDAQGNIVSSFGTRGRGAGQFSDPADIVISPLGRIYVADKGSDRVQVFGLDGIFQNEIPKLDSPRELAVGPQETLYVLEKKRISYYSAQGALLGAFGNVEDGGVANLEDARDLLVTLDRVLVLDGDVIKVYTLDGKYLRSLGIKGRNRGEFAEPVAIARKNESSFYVAERGNKRIQGFLTQYKPTAPQQLQADADVHAIALRWADPKLPYIKQYVIYRSKEADRGFERVATSAVPQYVDRGLEVNGKYYYRVGAETVTGHEGETSAVVSAAAKAFTPPAVTEVQVEPGPWQLKIRWQPIESEYLAGYRIYQKEGDAFVQIGESVLPEFTKGGLTPSTKYSYFISAVSRDGPESEKTVVNASTAVFTKPPLEIEVLKLRDIFSNTYKLYEQDGVGLVRLTNNTDKPMEGVKLAFTLKDFMDYATETQVGELLPGQSVEITLKAVFNNAILTVTEDSSVQTMLEASYFENGQPQVFSKNPTIRVYEKHKLLWDERERYASFITPKDPPLVTFTRSVITQYGEVKDESLLASLIFHAMGTLGMTYVHDPSNPYQLMSGGTNVVDYVQFPRETLAHKAGDCDDLVAFYSAALESIGIETRVLEVPEHMLMMFSTGIPAEADGWNNDDMYVIYEGKLWIPVETTLVGNKFLTAWEKGAETYYKWKDKGLTILDARAAWATFKPASLPEIKDKAPEVKKADIDRKFPGEFAAMMKISSNAKTHRYREVLEEEPGNAEAYQQIGIILAKMGDYEEAMKHFDKVLSLDPKNAAALNNRGNLLVILDRYEEAEKAYRAATEASPDDPYVWINLTQVYRKLKNTKGAKEAFARALKLNPDIKKQYKTLNLELSSTLD